MKLNKDKYANRNTRTELKDGRVLIAKKIKGEYFLESKDGSVLLPVSKEYYDKCIKLAKNV